jgi:hypothetical protein
MHVEISIPLTTPGSSALISKLLPSDIELGPSVSDIDFIQKYEIDFKIGQLQDRPPHQVFETCVGILLEFSRKNLDDEETAKNYTQVVMFFLTTHFEMKYLDHPDMRHQYGILHEFNFKCVNRNICFRISMANTLLLLTCSLWGSSSFFASFNETSRIINKMLKTYAFLSLFSHPHSRHQHQQETIHQDALS